MVIDKIKQQEYNRTYREKNIEKVREIKRNWLDKNKEKHKISDKKWREENKDKCREKMSRYKKLNKIKVNARNLAAKYILIPNEQVCQICCIKKAEQRHHKDYSKPLEVMFVCKSCHYGIGGNKNRNK